jgi:MSHA biogenesis protein MshM
MYLAHFGLRELPFGLTPDTSFFFACSNYQEALNTLLVAARNGEGFIKIVGEVGVGKTLLCHKFLATLNNGDVGAATGLDALHGGDEKHHGGKFLTAYIPNPYLEPRSLLMELAQRLRVALDDDADQHQMLRGLTLALLNAARDGKRVLVCLDEAQAMPLESLEVLRLLTNLETEKRKLLQVVLFGQPELDVRLGQNSVRQLRQRISFQYELGGLRKGELERYLGHRLTVAGYHREPLFRRSAISKMQRVTHGTPRLVNIIAHKAMLLAYGEGCQQVLARHVQGAAADTPESRRDWNILAWGATALAAVGLAAGWMLMQ